MLDSDTLPFVAREDSAFFGYTYASPENVQEVAPFLVQSLKGKLDSAQIPRETQGVPPSFVLLKPPVAARAPHLTALSRRFC